MRETLFSLHIISNWVSEAPHMAWLCCCSVVVHLAFFILDAKHGTLNDFPTVELLSVTPRNLWRQVDSIWPPPPRLPSNLTCGAVPLRAFMLLPIHFDFCLVKGIFIKRSQVSKSPSNRDQCTKFNDQCYASISVLLSLPNVHANQWPQSHWNKES